MLPCGWLLLLAGIVLLPLPLPFGLPLLALGTAVLTRYSAAARRTLLRVARSHTGLRRLLVLLPRRRPR